ncbi:ubiquilin-1-like [Numida meleagris]|uniref:ubiquilin-1-like n=1 Tax=Numida meleagris TaxID=8996 RepID=UPI000B3E01F0|nr:ubiquilin-1-like [Numida meleagris]
MGPAVLCGQGRWGGERVEQLCHIWLVCTLWCCRERRSLSVPLLPPSCHHSRRNRPHFGWQLLPPPLRAPHLPAALLLDRSNHRATIMSENKGAAGVGQPIVTTDSANVIKVMVKTLKQKEQFEVAQSSTIQQFKEDIATRFQTPPDLLVLIFAGKVLKDHDTLSQHRVHDGASIHLVIRSPKRPQDGQADQGAAAALVQPPSHSGSNLFLESIADVHNLVFIPQNVPGLLTSSQEIVAQTTEDLLFRMINSELDLNTINNNMFLLGFLLGVTGTNILGLDSADVSEVVSSVQGPGVSTHSLLSEVAQSAFRQSILSNPNLVSDIITSSPQMQQLAEQNPEIIRMLTSSHTVRDILEACSSPAVMQEMIRNHDLAMNNLESLPGGYSVLEQLYREIEEPILDAVQTQMEDNVFAALDSNPAPGGARLPARTENRRPLPNPWAPQPSRGGDNAFEWDEHLANSSESLIEVNLGPAVNVVEPSLGGVQSMVQQLTENSELMHGLESVITNPGSPVQMLLNGDHASSDGNSPPENQSTQQLPPEMENAEISSLLRNPRALQALLQVQLGLHTLNAEVPDFILSLGEAPVELESMDSSSQSSEVEDVSLESEQSEEEEQAEMDEQEP